MYYKVTKEQYKKHEGDFKKTYVGNRKYMKKMTSFVAFMLFIIDVFIGIISINLGGNANDLIPDLNGLLSLAGIIITGICTVIVSFDYENNLREYINCKK